MTARHLRGDCALLMVPLLGISGLVIDGGYAYFTQRTLQAQADAAALAGAQRLPDAHPAITAYQALQLSLIHI